MTDLVLKGSQRIVYDYLKSQPGTAISHLGLSNELGYTPKTIRRAICALCQFGLVKTQRTSRRKPFTYQVVQ